MPKCPVCESAETTRQLGGEEIVAPEASDFRVTDDRYGVTGPLYSCDACGFLFVLFDTDPMILYERMRDPVYEEGREYRRAQQRAILQRLLKLRPHASSLLDVGAGNGMLVQEASLMGLDAVGVEPSAWAVDVAGRHGTNVIRGTIPHDDLKGRTFDFVVLVDVIEHTTDPVQLLRDCRPYLAEKGLLLVSTPDVGSIAARLMGSRWWHYRIAHVGYFSRVTLQNALHRAEFEVLLVRRPGWVFDLRYLTTRLSRYLPFLKPPTAQSGFAAWFFARTIPLNLRDSLEVDACRR